MNLRPYQRGSIDDLHCWFHANREGNPVMVLPTGAGKSVVMAEFIREASCTWPGTRILSLAHQKELLEQNSAKLAELWPTAPMGVYSAGMRRYEAHASVLFAGVQSVWRRPALLGHRDLVLIDECHLVNQSHGGMYRKLVDGLRKVNPAVRVIGWTATAFRTGHGDITFGEDALFSGTAHETTIRELLDGGFLSPLRSKKTETDFDLSGMRVQRGEFNAADAAAAMGVHAKTAKALDEVVARGTDRKSWLLFCSGVENAQNVAVELRARGIPTECVTGTTPKDEREAILSAFRAGELRALSNCNLLSCGYDAPNIDLIAMLAPTMSPGRYVQCAGRGMRTAPGKRDCLFLDFAKVIDLHGPVDQIRPWQPRQRRGGEAIVKACPQCAELVAVQTRECPECGFAFPFEEHGPNHTERASNAAILSDGLAPATQRVAVDRVTYHQHHKGGDLDATPTLRVEYHAGLLRYKEWVTLNHDGRAKLRARRWFYARNLSRHWRAPDSCDVIDAMALGNSGELAEPTHIDVDVTGKYPQIVGYVFDTETEQAA